MPPRPAGRLTGGCIKNRINLLRIEYFKVLLEGNKGYL
jgi:hypothetical protein